jgi:hypothetical protein
MSFMVGYENPDYVFPYSSCLNSQTEQTLTDKMIGMIIFASSEDWAQLKIAYDDFKSIVEQAGTECDVNKVYSSIVSTMTGPISALVVRLWWNSVFLYENCEEFAANLFTDLSLALTALGSCMKFIYPNS